MNITRVTYGTTDANETVLLYCLKNTSGAYVSITNYGCRIVEIVVPDQNGAFTDVALGFQDFDAYQKDDASLGAVVGRYANRIANASFTLNDVSYPLAANNGPNHLHGGPTGFANRVWDSKVEDDRLIFTRTSVDGEEGFPGTLNLRVIYTFSEDNELSIAYEATTDADTIINLTNHCYFNLNGAGDDTALDLELSLDADSVTELNDVQIPTGKLLSVENTPFDFRTRKELGWNFKNSNEQFQISGTYDHNFVLNGNGFCEAAVLQSKKTGIRMTCFTDQPGLQLYIPSYSLPIIGKHDIPYKPFSSVCLETQHFADSIHHANFPSVLLKANDTFFSKTAYHFSTIS